MLTDVNDMIGEAWSYQKSLMDLLDDEDNCVHTLNSLYSLRVDTREYEARKSLDIDIHKTKIELYKCRYEISKRLNRDMDYYIPDKVEFYSPDDYD